MLISYPQALWILFAVPLVVFATLFWRRQSLRVSLTLALLRGLVLSLVILALTGPLLRWHHRQETLVLVVDVSASQGTGAWEDARKYLHEQAENHGSATKLAVVAVADRAVVMDGAEFLRAGDSHALFEKLAVKVNPSGGSALADGLQLASAQIPQEDSGRVVLISDGWETRGDAAAESLRLAHRGIALEVISREPLVSSDFLLRDLSLPSACRIGQKIPVTARIAAHCPGDVHLELVTAEGQSLASKKLSLAAGEQAVTLHVTPQKQGLTNLQVQLTDAQGKVLDQRPIALMVTGPAKSVVVESSADAPATSALAALLGNSAEVHTLAPASLDITENWSDADVLVLANVPAAQISDAAEQQLITAVRQGMGLLVTGGPDSLGPGGYATSSLATVLPVKMSQDLEKNDPSATLVIIIDTSGSMEGPRVALAKEVARLAMRRLQPHDKLGIVEFYGTKRWAAPIQPASNTLDLNRALDRLAASGGTLILPAIEESYYALKNVKTRTRHVLILTDGGVESGAFETLIRRMAQDGITVSTVLVGPGQHSDFLASLAEWGGGRSYSAPDRFNVPEIIVKQPQTQLLPPFVEQPTRLVPAGNDPIVGDINWSEAPSLEGYLRAVARPSADLLLQNDRQDPVLVRWQYGAGQVAVFTSAIGTQWSQSLAQWPQSASVFSGLVRSLHRRPAEGTIRIRPRIRPAGLELQFDAIASLQADLWQPLEISLERSDGSIARSITADPLNNGQWNVLLPLPAAGSYQIKVHGTDRSLAGVSGIAIDQPREVVSFHPNTTLLESLAASRISILDSSRQPADSEDYVDLMPCLILTSLALFLSTVLIRRWNFRSSRLATAAIFAVVIWGLPQSLAHAAPPATTQSSPRTNAAASPVAAPQVAASPATTQVDLPTDESMDLAAAAQALELQLKQDPTDAAATLRLARIYEARGEEAQVVKLLASAQKQIPDSVQRRQLLLRQVLLLIEMDRAAEAQPLLQEVAKDPQDRVQVALLSQIMGDSASARRVLGPIRAEDGIYELSLRGQCALDVNEPEVARQAFELALAKATIPRDRRFLLERLIASARSQGQLGRLADQWLADPVLPADEYQPLASILRELSRVDDLLGFVSAHGDSQATRNESWPAVQRELLAAIIDSGRLDDAQRVYESLLAKDSSNPDWLDGLAQLKLLRDDEAGCEQLLNHRIDQATDLNEIRRLGQLAQSLGRTASADRAARAAMHFGDDAKLESLILLAQSARQAGNAAEARQLLQQAVQTGTDKPQKILIVADMLEQFGYRSEAIALLKRPSAQSSQEEILQRLARLYERDRRLPEAQAVWRNLWKASKNAARRQEARSRVLELSAKNGTLADLAVDLEESLSKGEAGQEELSMLVEIYASIKDAASAAETLQTFRKQAGGEVNMLRQLTSLYQRCQQFGQADRTLRRLLVADPPSAPDTLQQIAVLAMERKRPADAQWALAELSRRSGQDVDLVALRAGVLDRLGLYAEAADAYGHSLKEHPDRVEDWLLWAGAMSSAGRKEQAINKLLLLAGEPGSDDLFIAVADGLLNLQASDPVLRVVLRDAILRVAASPQKIALYNIGSDIADDAGSPDRAVNLLEASLLVAGEQRTTLLRDLIARCKSTGKIEHTRALSSTLISLGEEVPPQVHLELGQLLLDAGRFVDAERCFRNARQSGDTQAVSRQVIDLYEQSGYIPQAQAIAAEMLRLNPADLSMVVRVAELAELAGRHDQAAGTYLKALSLLLSRQADALSDATGPASAPDKKPRDARARPAGATTLDEYEQYANFCLEGLISCSRSESARTLAIQGIQAIGRKELASLPSDRAGLQLRQRPRLRLTAEILRRLAFSLHKPEIADDFDRDLIAAFPADASVASQAAHDRQDWGLLDRAASFASAHVATAPTSGPAAEHTGAITPERAAEQLPGLILAGQKDKARRILQSTTLRLPEKPDTTIPVLLAAAFVLEDQAAADQWAALLWGPSTTASDRTDYALRISKYVRTVWPVLSSTGRRQLLDRLILAQASSKPSDRSPLALQCLRIAQAISVDLHEAPALRLDVAKGNSLTATVLAEILRSAPAAEKDALLSAAIMGRPEASRRGLLLQWLALWKQPLEGSALDQFTQLLASSPLPNTANVTRQADVPSIQWARNAHQNQAALLVASQLLKQSPDDPISQVAAATAYQVAGQSNQANELARKALVRITSRKQIRPADLSILEDAVLALDAPSSQQLLAEIQTNPSRTGRANQLLHVLLLQRVGRQDEVVDLLGALFRESPSDTEIRGLLIDQAEENFRYADLVQWWTPYLLDDAVTKIYERGRLARSLVALQRYNDARKLLGGGSNLMDSLYRLQVCMISGEDEATLHTLQSLIVQNRRDRRYFTPFMPIIPSIGGMQDAAGISDDPLSRRQSVYHGLADRPYAMDQISNLLAATPPVGRDAAGMIDGILDTAARWPDQRNSLVQTLVAQQQSGSLNTNDRLIILGLARDPASQLPAPLLHELDNILATASSLDSQSLVRLIGAYRQRGNSAQASAIAQWTVAMAIVPQDALRSSTTFLLRKADLSLVLEQLPQSQRVRVLEALATAPVDTPEDRSEAIRLSFLSQEKSPDSASNLLEQYRQRGWIDPDSRLASLAARFAADRGDVQAYTQSLTQLLSSGDGQSSVVPTGINSILPPKASSHQAQLLAAATLSVINQLPVEMLSLADRCQLLSMLAVWSHDNAVQEISDQALDQAHRLTVGNSASALWVADAARAVSQPALAIEMETQAVRRRALPAGRIVQLLKDVAQIQGEDAAKELAVEITASGIAPISGPSTQEGQHD